MATFCHNIARGLPIQVNDPAAPVTLVYVDDVVERFVQLMDESLRHCDLSCRTTICHAGPDPASMQPGRGLRIESAMTGANSIVYRVVK